MRSVARQPLFWIGVALRVALVAGVAALAPTMAAGTLDFPAGPASWLPTHALIAFAQVLGAGPRLGLLLFVLLADVGMLVALRAATRIETPALLRWYWLSPFVLGVAYGLAGVELAGAAWLCGAFGAVRSERPRLAAVAAALAVASHLAALLALPLFVIYWLRNRPLRAQLRPFLQTLAVAGVALACLGVLTSHGGVEDALRSPWLAQLRALSVPLGAARVELFPLAWVLALCAAWRLRRVSFDVLCALGGLLFLGTQLLTNQSPQWLLWALPALVLFQAERGFVACTLANTLAALGSMALVQPAGLGPTLAVAAGAVAIAAIWRTTVHGNEQLRMSRRPLVIGIAGDSGAGKDTLVDSLAAVFDERSVARLSGDDYHFWDRQKPMWQVMTHLNPRANDLNRLARDVVALADGKSIVAPHYDHATGRMTKAMRVDTNDCIIVSGLHALYLPILRRCYDLSIFLDIDDGLRRYLKLERDVKRRGHSVERVLASLAGRRADAERFIQPQREQADLVLALHPVNPSLLETTANPADLRLKLVVRSREAFQEESLLRSLVGTCGLQVDMTLGEGGSLVEMTIEGESQAEDIALVARKLVPQLQPLMRAEPSWEDGVKGLMQLVVLSHLNQAMSHRLI